MEAGLPLYGHELDRETSPLEAGLATFVKFGRGFVGETALRARQASGLKKKLIGIRTNNGKSIARQGYPLIQDGQRVGVVTSGTFAPTFNRPLAMGFVDPAILDRSRPDVHLSVEIRAREIDAAIVPLPFYKRGRPS
jgi:aminomethyltransferase